MPLAPQEGLEVIPGYRLVKRLGTGGYGEVWQAAAPGGLNKAVKFVFGHVRDARAAQELRSLNRIKEVRHPFLLSLERLEVLDGQLVIVTELADMSLLDRYEQCHRAGLVGIPRDELLGFLRDAADALDYMSDTHGLQHLDIKPQNLLLVGKHIKIADFGQVKDLQGTSATATGAVTALYAPPEAFDGRVSRHSDQYSLAIVYQEMLTGSRPYQGTSALQLVAQHASSPPDLEALPPLDRPAIARALSKRPEARFSSCRELIDQLILAPAGPLTPRVRETPSLFVPPAPPANAVEGDEITVIAERSRGPIAPPGLEATMLFDSSAELDLDEPESVRPPVVARVRPTLFLGIGGLAGAALQRLRGRLHAHFGDLSRVPVLRFLYLDTDRSSVQRVQQGGLAEALTADETLTVALHPVESNRRRAKELLRWIERRWLYSVPRSLLPEGLRPLGRLALIDNAEGVLGRLRESLVALSSSKARTTALQTGYLELRCQAPRIFLLASIAGGTGGGMVVDLAYAVRQLLTELNLPADAVCALLLHATAANPDAADLARVNAYATMQEIHHLMRPDTPYTGEPLLGLLPCRPEVPPFDTAYLVHLGDDLEFAAVQARTDVVAEYLYLDALSEAGAFLDEYRQQPPAQQADAPPVESVRTFGLHRIHFPRLDLAQATGDHVCMHLVEAWHGTLMDTPAQGSGSEARLPECPVEYSAEALEQLCMVAARTIWGREPDEHFKTLVAAFPLCQKRRLDRRVVPELSRRLIQQIEEAIGVGHPAEMAPELAPDCLRARLQAWVEAHTLRLKQQLAGWMRSLVENPAYRLNGAERAVRWLGEQVGTTTEALHARVDQIRGLRSQRRFDLEFGDAVKGASTIGWLSRWRSHGPAKFMELFLDYCWLCFGEALAESQVAILLSLADDVARCAKDVALGQERLVHLAGVFRSAVAATAKDTATTTALPHVVEVLPERAPDKARVAQSIFRRMGPRLMQRLDADVQREVLDQHGGLWGLMSGPNDLVSIVQAQMREQARQAVLEVLRPLDASGVFLHAQGEPARAGRTLRAAIESSAPEVVPRDTPRHIVLVMPPGPAAESLVNALAGALHTTPPLVAGSSDDIILLQECAPVPIPAVIAALLGLQANYAEVARRVLTRVDVPWSPLLPPERG